MTVETDILSALQSLAGGRVYPDEAPANTAAPYIVYIQVGGPSPAYVERNLPDIKGARFQLSVWSERREEASALSLLVESALVQSTDFDAKPVGAGVAAIDPVTKLRGMRQDFSIWSPR